MRLWTILYIRESLASVHLWASSHYWKSVSIWVTELCWMLSFFILALKHLYLAAKHLCSVLVPYHAAVFRNWSNQGLVGLVLDIWVTLFRKWSLLFTTCTGSILVVNLVIGLVCVSVCLSAHPSVRTHISVTTGRNFYNLGTVPIISKCWYSLVSQIQWQKCLFLKKVPML